MTTTHIDPLDALLRDMAPQVSIVDAADGSAALAAEVVSSSRRTGARWLTSRRRRIAAVAAALVLVPSVAVAGPQFLARTGIFGQPGLTENDTSEWVNVCAADFPAFLRSLPKPTGAAPAGTTWDAITREVVGRNVKGVGQGCATGSSMVQTSTLRADFLVVAQMHWTCTALRDHANGDDPRARIAAREVAAIYNRLASARRFGDSNWRPNRDAAGRGDFSALQRDAAINYPAGYCSSLDRAR